MRTLHDHESCFHFFHVCPFQIRHIEFDWGVRITKYISQLYYFYAPNGLNVNEIVIRPILSISLL